MRAVTLESVGSDAVPTVREVAAPIALMSDVLVDVHAAGVNPIDWKTISGRGVSAGIQRFPWVPGND